MKIRFLKRYAKKRTDKMNYKNISDLHTHCHFSFDSTEPPENMLKKAEELGLKYFAMTDHCECHIYFKDGFDKDMAKAYEWMSKAKEEYKGPVKFLKGIELGQPTQGMDEALHALNGCDYDIVLGSLHNIKDEEDFFFWKRMTMEVDYGLDRYFSEIMEMLDYKIFDVLTHLTYPARYIYCECGEDIDYKKYIDRVEALLKKLVNKGYALEMNMKKDFIKLHDIYPDIEIFKMYKSLGGELVTIGSDAHDTAFLGHGMQEAMEMLKSVGFDSYTVFEKRKPIQIAIE